MTKKPFSSEAAKLWILEFESQGKGWPSVEGFLLREYLNGHLTLDDCQIVRQIFWEMNPYLPSPPQWRLLKRWLGKSYAPKPILKRVQVTTQKIEQPEPDPLPQWDGEPLPEWNGELPIEDLDLPYSLLELFAGR